MVSEVIGEVVIPSDLIIPVKTNSNQTNLKKGHLYISGAKLYFYTGTQIELVTSTQNS